MFGRIKLDAADIIFSEFVRRRDKICVRCKKWGTGEKGIDGLQNSHYFGRGNESTRFDPENCDALCFGCHEFWGSRNREDYREFKIKQLGEKGFKNLSIRTRMMQKKDRKLSYIASKYLLNELIKSEI